MLAAFESAAIVGVDPYPVRVEVDVISGIPTFEIVGLPDTCVRESRVRVKSAIRNSGFEFPNRRIHVNLAPGEIKKEGASFDLPIALAILKATGQLLVDMEGRFLVAGELSLNGDVMEVRGTISMASGARDSGFDFMLVPSGNAREAAIVPGIEIYGVSSLKEAASFLQGCRCAARTAVDADSILDNDSSYPHDFAEVKGQEHARRALEVAAAGGHNLLMIGPPGSGKTMLARRLPSILPPLTLEEALEVTRIHSVAGLIPPGGSLITKRPFRAPGNSTTAVGLTGGGNPLPRPGEVSLAHCGVLYLDELTLFQRGALESLRAPLEDGEVTIVRSMLSVRYPAAFSLVASMNPCPCGYLGDPVRQCSCTRVEILRYMSMISGPLLDRIDMHIEVPRLRREHILSKKGSEPSASIRKRVVRARDAQRKRFSSSGVHSNSRMTGALIERFCEMTPEAERFLAQAIDRLGFSARSCHKILKVARTIADLAGSGKLGVEHIAEAVQYRSLERLGGERC